MILKSVSYDQKLRSFLSYRTMTMTDKPRYVQQTMRGGVKRWRYNPPQDAVEAGIVSRVYPSTRKETAFNEAERFNRAIDAWREEKTQVHVYDQTVNGLIQEYLNSLDYQKLKDETKKVYKYQLSMIVLTEVKGKLL